MGGVASRPAGLLKGETRMLAIQLKNYLNRFPDEANVLIYVSKTGEVRQLIMSDLDRKNGNIVIDAEYVPPVKHTTIERRRKCHQT